MTLSRRTALMGMTAVIATTALPAIAAPSASLIDSYWQASGGAAGPDNSAYASFLATYVRPGADGVNRVAYGSVSPADKQALKGYIASLEASRPTTMTRDSAMANDIEHGIMRPIWNDPRIHYAVNCASIGCPNLMMQPFNAQNLAGMLDQAARNYVNHPRGAAVEGGRLIVSSIYDWYAVDFGNNDAGVIAHLRQYATGPLAASLASVSSISSDRYDWNLNGI